MSLIEWALTALTVSFLAGAMGLLGVARGPREVARAVAGIFLVVALIMFVAVVLGVGAVTPTSLAI